MDKVTEQRFPRLVDVMKWKCVDDSLHETQVDAFRRSLKLRPAEELVETAVPVWECSDGEKFEEEIDALRHQVGVYEMGR